MNKETKKTAEDYKREYIEVIKAMFPNYLENKKKSS